MGKLEDYKSNLPAIVGSTTINHAARVSLGLTCSEYVLLEHLHHVIEKKLRSEPTSIYLGTGFVEQEVDALMKNLIVKGFVQIIEPITGAWGLTHKFSEGFPNIESEFDNYFWKEVISSPGSKIGEHKVAWSGPRKKALELYVKLRKKHSKDFLVSQRDNYFKFLALQKQLRGFDQQRMMCQVFLNPANERYTEDYEDYIRQLKAKYGDPEAPKIKPVTTADIMEQYGKDNHQ